jgi:hypothetical protein
MDIQMNIQHEQRPLQNPVLRYFFESWIQACGNGWTHRQVLVAYLCSVLFAVGLLMYANVMRFDWSWI